MKENFSRKEVGELIILGMVLGAVIPIAIFLLLSVESNKKHEEDLRSAYYLGVNSGKFVARTSTQIYFLKKDSIQLQVNDIPLMKHISDSVDKNYPFDLYVKLFREKK